MSKLLLPASLEPATLIVLLAVPGLTVSVDVPATAALQLISSPVIDRAPILVKAPVSATVPVPASKVKARFELATEPSTALLIEILPLLVRLSSTTASAIVSVTPEPPNVIYPAPVLARDVVKLPANVTLVGPPSAGVLR